MSTTLVTLLSAAVLYLTRKRLTALEKARTGEGHGFWREAIVEKLRKEVDNVEEIFWR